MSSFFAAAAARKRNRFVAGIEGMVADAVSAAAETGKNAAEIARIQQSIRNNYPIPAKVTSPARPKLFIVK